MAARRQIGTLRAPLQMDLAVLSWALTAWVRLSPAAQLCVTLVRGMAHPGEELC